MCVSFSPFYGEKGTMCVSFFPFYGEKGTARSVARLLLPAGGEKVPGGRMRGERRGRSCVVNTRRVDRMHVWHEYTQRSGNVRKLCGR